MEGEDRPIRSSCVYSCVLVAAAYVGNFLTGGLTMAVGVYYVHFLDVLDYTNSAQVALAISLNTVMYFLAGPLGGILINRFGCRFTGILGGLLAGTSLAVSQLSSSVYSVCVWFGVACGTGIGLSYMASVFCVSDHFTKYRPLALAVSASAMGVGTFLYPVLIRYLIPTYGWRGSLLILAGLAFNAVVCGAVIRSPDEERRRPEDQDIVKHTPKGIFNLHILKKPEYLLLCLCNLFARIGLTIFFVHLGAYANIKGISSYHASLLFSTFGAANIVGKLIFGAILQIPGCTGMHIYIIGFGTGALAIFLITVTKNYAILHVLSATVGIGLANFSLSIVEINLQVLGKDQAASGTGNAMVFMAFGGLIGGPMGSIIYEKTGFYEYSFYFGSGMTGLAAAFMCLPLCARKVFHCGGTNSNSTLTIRVKAEEVI